MTRILHSRGQAAVIIIRAWAVFTLNRAKSSTFSFQGISKEPLETPVAQICINSFPAVLDIELNVCRLQLQGSSSIALIEKKISLWVSCSSFPCVFLPEVQIDFFNLIWTFCCRGGFYTLSLALSRCLMKRFPTICLLHPAVAANLFKFANTTA